MERRPWCSTWTARFARCALPAAWLLAAGCGEQGGEEVGGRLGGGGGVGTLRAVFGNGDSADASLSRDGRWLVFSSEATDLGGAGAGDTNRVMDVYRADRPARRYERVSVSSEDLQANGPSGRLSPAAVSGDGRYVAFSSTATNLSPEPATGTANVYVRDTVSRDTWLLSMGQTGAAGNGDSLFPALSGDGSHVAFQSRATNLVPGTTHPNGNIYVADRAHGQIQVVSRGLGGLQGNGDSGKPSLSDDGRFVAFESEADNLTSGDANGVKDVFLFDRARAAMTMVSVPVSGLRANGASFSPRISGDGRFVAFASEATNLVTGDGNGATDIFVYDRLSGDTERVNLPRPGIEADGESDSPGLSGDGTFVVFSSRAANLVQGVLPGLWNIYVANRVSGDIELVSRSLRGGGGNGSSRYPFISGNGRSVAFQSSADDLGSGFPRSDVTVYAFSNPLH